jgi:hypothetical protein
MWECRMTLADSFGWFEDVVIRDLYWVDVESEIILFVLEGYS